MKAILRLQIFSLLSLILIALINNSRLGAHSFSIIPDKYHNNTVYLSLIPTFDSPNDFQILLKSNINKAINEGYSYYVGLTKEDFDLNDLLSEELKSIKLAVYLEDDIQRIPINTFHFDIEKTIYKKKLDKLEEISDYPSYIVFGGQTKHCGQGIYNLLHLIEGPGNYDHIVQANLALDNKYEDGSVIYLKTAKNNIENKIKEGAYYEGYITLKSGDKNEITVFDVIQYFCLQGPNFNKHCNKISLNFLDY